MRSVDERRTTPDRSEHRRELRLLAKQATGASGESRHPRARMALGLVEVALLVAALFGAWHVLTVNWNDESRDVLEYYRYARAFWLGTPRFRALPVEYPPLAILPFSLTLLPGNVEHHAVYAVWMGALVLLTYAGYVRYSTRWRGVVWLVYLLLGTTGVFLERFDLVPTAVTLAALWSAERRRYRLAYALLAVGILLKLYPVFLLPVVAIAQWRTLDAPVASPAASSAAQGQPRQAARRAILSAAKTILCDALPGMALVVLGFGIAYVLNAPGTLSEFRYAMDRPIQVESTPASLMWLASLVGVPLRSGFSFGSYNAFGPLAGTLKPLSSLALALGCVWVYWRQARGRLTLRRALLACLCVVLVTNKLFSAQYLLWVLPFAAEAEGLDLLWLGICLLTTYEYPILFHASSAHWTTTYFWPYMLTLTFRNALLVWVTLRAVVGYPARVPWSAVPGAFRGRRWQRQPLQENRVL